MKIGSLLITLTLVVLCLGGNALADGLSPVGDPFAAGSWAQTFNDKATPLAFNNFKIVMTSPGDAFVSQAFYGFTVGGWTSATALDLLSATASGPLTTNMNFNIHFGGVQSDPLSFTFLAYQNTYLVEYAFADWNGHTWAIEDHYNNAVPEPASLLLFGSGLIGVGGFIRRRLLG